MSALPCATNSRPDQPLFSLKGQSGGIGAISSLTVSSLLVESSEIGLGGNQYISSIGGQLFYYNGSVLEPISALSSISSIEAWSEYPAISTVNLAGENLIGGNMITGTSLSTLTAEVSSLSATEGSVLTFSMSTMTGEVAAISTIGASSVVADNLQTSTLTTGDLMTSTLTALAIGTSSITGNFGFLSTVNAISSIADSAVVNTQLLASSIATNDLRVSSIVADDISTFTLTAISTVHAISSISSATVTADALLNISSINGQPISFYEPGGVSTVSTFQQLGTSSLTTSTINGFVPDSVANWANYGAVGQVNLQNNTLYSGSGSADDVNIVAERYVKNTAEKVYINADEGTFDVINNSLIQLSTTNGFRGEIDLIANEGNVLGGKITLTANGADIAGLLYGGVIELTANTGGGFIPAPAATSAIRLSAASILEYSGATNSIGSVAGYGFYHGDLGVNITAGVPPLAPNDPLTVYLFGTNGVLVYCPMYVYGPIRPYSDLTNNPVDLYIEDYSNGLSHGYVQLRGVSTQTFAGGDTAILGLNRLQFSTIAGALENVSSINGQPISFYEPGGVSTLSSFTELYTSSFAASTIVTDQISSLALDNVSSINGLPIGELINVSSISSLNEWSYYPAISSINADGYDVIRVNSVQAVPTGGMDIVSDNGVNILTTGGAKAPFVAGDTTLSSLNVAEKIDFDVNTASTLTLKVHNGTDNASLVANSVTAPTVATGFIQGTATDMFGIPGFNDGIVVRASSIAITSTPQVLFTGFLNASTCAFFQGNIRDVICSTINASSISTYFIGANQINTNAFDTSLITVNLISSVSSVSYAAQNLVTQTSTLNAGFISSGALNVSSINFAQSGAYGLSSLMYVSSSFIPGAAGATSTTLYANTDLSLGQQDLYCQQIRLGYLNPSNQASEIIMYNPASSTISIGVNNFDRAFRVSPFINTAGSSGYVLDTFMNPPFFSTINQSTAMMAYFPSTAQNTIGFSTISVIPPIKAFGSWYSSTSQTVVGANTVTPLTYNSEAVNIGGYTYAGSTITVPTAGSYRIGHSIQFDTTSGGTNQVQFWYKKNGADIPQTNSIVSITNNGDTVGTIDLIDTANAGDQYAVVMYSADANMTAAAVAAGATPAIPSLITNIVRL